MKPEPNMTGACIPMMPRTPRRALMYSMCAFALALGPAMADDDQGDRRDRTHRVKCDKGQSIQKRLDKARPGDTIKVKGDCTENIIIRVDDLSLVCVYGASIGSTSGATIIVRATDVKISDCAITGETVAGTGVLVDRSSSAVLTDNTASGMRTGFVITQGSYARLVGTASAPDAPSQSASGNSGNGVTITGASHVDIFRNDISGNGGHGVFMSRNSSADIVGNDLNDNGGRGVAMFRSSSADFSSDITFGTEANRISGNGSNGIACFHNGAVGFGVSQDFTGGNGGSDFFTPSATSNGCSVSGTP